MNPITEFHRINEFDTEIVKYNPKVKNIIVALHGFGGSAGTFRNFGKILPETHSLWSVSLPWHGNTKQLHKDSLLDGQTFANDLADFIRKEANNKITLLAHSFGARIAAILAVNHPNLIKKLVFIAPGGFYKPEDFMFRFLSSPLCRFISKRDFVLSAVTGFLIPGIKGAKKEKAIIALRNIGQSFKTVNVKKLGIVDHLKTFDFDFLLILGTKDRLLPTSYAPKITRYFKNASFVSIDGSGHLPMVDNPKKVMEVITEE